MNEEKIEQNDVSVREKSIEKKEKKNYLKVSNIIYIVLIIIFSLSIAPKTLQNDTYYTIKIGEWITQNGISDLTKDMYSWHENLPYTYPHWLYDFLVYQIYSVLGHLGIYMSTIVLSIILGLSIYKLSKEKSGSNIISFLVTWGALYLVADFIAARAQLVTFILFVWEVFFIEKFLQKKKVGYVIMLLLIPLLITNLHCAVYPMYFVFLLPYVVEYLMLLINDLDLDIKLYGKVLRILRKFAKKEDKIAKLDAKITKNEAIKANANTVREERRKEPYRILVEKNKNVLWLMLIMFIAAFIGFLNPAGTGAYTYIYKTMQGNTMDSINEHLPLTLINNIPFAISFLLFLVIMIFSKVKIKLHDLFMLAGLMFLTFKSRRQESLYAILCAPILASMIMNFAPAYLRKIIDKAERFIGDWFGAIVIVCLFIIVYTSHIEKRINSDYVDVNAYPEAASDWILANCDLNEIKVYNQYNFGSYLLFRGIPVYIDSRCDLYTPQFNADEKNEIEGRDIFSEALSIDAVNEDYNAKFEKYGVTHVLLYTDSRLGMILGTDSRYKLVYNVGNFKIYERIGSISEDKEESEEIVEESDSVGLYLLNTDIPY